MNPSALALAYAQDVVAGKVLAGRYAQLACQRFLDDLKRIGTEGFPYTFEWDRADDVIEFQQTLPQHDMLVRLEHLDGDSRRIVVTEPATEATA